MLPVVWSQSCLPPFYNVKRAYVWTGLVVRCSWKYAWNVSDALSHSGKTPPWLRRGRRAKMYFSWMDNVGKGLLMSLMLLMKYIYQVLNIRSNATVPSTIIGTLSECDQNRLWKNMSLLFILLVFLLKIFTKILPFHWSKIIERIFFFDIK